MSKKEKIPKEVIITGILALLILECVAMYHGINGWLLRAVVVIIAVAIGVYIPKDKLKVLQ